MRGRSRDTAEPWGTKMVATSGQKKFAGKLTSAYYREKMVKFCAAVNCEKRWQSGKKGGESENKVSFHK